MSSGTASSLTKEYQVFLSQGKKGLRDDNGLVVIPATYDNLGWSDGNENPVDDVLGYEENDKWGIISTSNSRITDALYEKLYPVKGDMLISSRKSDFSSKARFGVLDKSGKAVVGFQYANLVPCKNKLLASQIISGENMAYGLINYSEEVIIPVVYGSLHEVNTGYAASESGLFAYFDETGKQLTKFSYDQIQPLNDKYSKCLIRGKIGLLDRKGNVVVNPEYKSAEFVNDSLVLLTEFPLWEFVLPGKEPLAMFSYDSMDPVSHGVYEVSANGHNALINIQEEVIVEKGQWSIDLLDEQFVLVENNQKFGVLKEGGISLIPMQYDSIYYSGEHFFALKDFNGKPLWQIYSTFGTPISSTYFEAVGLMNDGLMPAKKNGYWGYVDFSGHVAIAFKYDHSSSFKDGRARVNYLGNYGIINSAGQWVVNPEHEQIEVINKDLFISRRAERSDIINSAGKVVYQTYHALEAHSLGVKEVTSSGKYGLINEKGERILAPEFDYISDLKDDQLMIVNRDDDWGVVDRKGSFIINMTDEYQEIRDFSEDFLVIKKDDRYGFIDLNGKLRIANRYDDVQTFNDGQAAVKILGNWGFIDRLERLSIQPRYDRIGVFINQVAIVKEDGNFGLINRDDEDLIDIVYDSIWTLSSGSYMIKQNGQYGLVSSNGTMRINPKYDYLEENDNGFVIIEKRKKTGVLNSMGLDIIPSIYDQIYYDQLNGHYLLKTEGKTKKLVLSN
ncbi:MAG: WG repeat-containing protein [Bacteroidetes bacterium]|nr:WG repeat-containing protein [Bacteroidota bacterium]MDA1119408.1 WG repeat-containing protein [Bacteroidota bacterium]